MNFNFGEVLVRALKITWKHKVLWIFGILSSCASLNAGGSGGTNVQRFDPRSNRIMDEVLPFTRDAVEWLPKNLWVIYVSIGILVLIGFIQFTFANLGHIGLIRGAYRAEMGVEKIRFGELWDDCRAYFWRVIGLSLAVWGPILVVLIAFGLVFIFSMDGKSYGLDEELLAALGASLLGLCCCLFPLKILLDLYHSQAIRSLTLEDLGILGSLKRGWQVFTSNFIELALMDLVLFFVKLIVGVVIAIPASIAIMPLVSQFMGGKLDTWTPVIVVGAILCAYTPVTWLLHGIATSYAESAWTLVYMNVTYLKDEPAPVEANA